MRLQILTARGFGVKGPFATYDEPTFPDKQSSDLALQPKLGMAVAATGFEWHPKLKLLGANTKTLSGTIVITGSVTLSVNETLSNERMWFKNVVLQQLTIPCGGKTEYAMNVLVSDPAAELLRDPACSDALTGPLESTYRQVMEAAWSHLDPQEMAVVKKQSEDVRSRWVSTTRR